MSEKYENDLLKEGILHFHSKEYALARRYFERALDAANDLQTRAQANYFLSQVEDDPRMKRQFLEETLAIDMGHAGARRALAILDGKLTPTEVVNPDAIPVAVEGTQPARSERFTCPQCGGRMVYSPDGTSLVCENCSCQQRLNTKMPGAEQDFFVAMANGKGFRKTISVKTFQCQGCGANFLLAPTDLSAICAYCGSTQVIVRDEARELIEPDAVIPMAFDQKQAAVFLAQWLAGKRIVLQPSDRSPRGLYQPVWAFALIGSLPWSGQVIRNKREVPVSGECPAQFNDVCIPGSPKLGGLFLEFLPEYSLATAPAYDPRFLAGWPAQVYEMTMADAALEARRISVQRICRDIHLEHGHVTDLHYSTSGISITSYRLILLPVWLIDYSFENQTRHVIINGQTGTVLGEIPKRGLKGRLENLLGT
jgi:Zn finger protein HypA/HybF involved in hydrogenase expression